MTSDDQTRVMSRALTRGATMLDDACDDCGNPLFRYQGEVFCPVCRELHGDEGTEEDEGEEKEETEPENGEGIEVKEEGEVNRAETNDAGGEISEVDEHLRKLARRLARDAAESADDPEAVERRLDALERTVEVRRLLRRNGSS